MWSIPYEGLEGQSNLRFSRFISPVYTIQPVVKPVVKPVWQPGKCLYTRYNRLSNPLSSRLYNRFDNRLYRVNGVIRIRYFTFRKRQFSSNHCWIRCICYKSDFMHLVKKISKSEVDFPSCARSTSAITHVDDQRSPNIHCVSEMSLLVSL